MKYAVRAGANLPACFQVADVAFEEREIFPPVRLDRLSDFVQVAPVAGGEIVEADDLPVQRQELFQKVGAYEACDRDAGSFVSLFVFPRRFHLSKYFAYPFVGLPNAYPVNPQDSRDLASLVPDALDGHVSDKRPGSTNFIFPAPRTDRFRRKIEFFVQRRKEIIALLCVFT